MKKVSLLLVAVLAITFAGCKGKAKQAEESCCKEKKECVQKMTNNMAQELGLNEEQAKQLLAVNAEYLPKLKGDKCGEKSCRSECKDKKEGCGDCEKACGDKACAGDCKDKKEGCCGDCKDKKESCGDCKKACGDKACAGDSAKCAGKPCKKALLEEYQAKVKAILTPEQAAKWEATSCPAHKSCGEKPCGERPCGDEPMR